jgi:hypothetical protein
MGRLADRRGVELVGHGSAPSRQRRSDRDSCVVAITPANVNLVGTADKTARGHSAAARAAAPQTVQLGVRVAPIADTGARSRRCERH